ncbi:hypothetical protein PSJ8397_00205 [Pseudooctadecabacter jejudonensis]|uniref:Uncharacterized protein n=1 Tax=Pseudooctadecabacter jejudonensis TaxID=1391910 RepID=A0A1Y5RCI4_9RHOB|nr:hypothetical protein PSJ8397_00205 [Pseudooctadecabacter jejudonensis]
MTVANLKNMSRGGLLVNSQTVGLVTFRLAR